MTPTEGGVNCGMGPEDIPLESPMPRSPILDREEPELSFEPDIPVEDEQPDS